MKIGEIIRLKYEQSGMRLTAFAEKINTGRNNVYNKQLKQLAKYFGLEKRISSHTARHTFACVGLEIGISLKTISDLLGHSSIRITEIYAKMNDTIRESEAAKFNLL